MTASPPRLELTAIRRQYGQVTALDDAGIVVHRGEVHALLGENGAGKSTLMKIAFGLEQPDAGTIRIDGTTLRFRSPADAMASGVGMVQQHFALVDAMTVAENVALATPGRYDLAASREALLRAGRESGLLLDPDAVVGELPVGAQQRLEIVRALVRDSRILILDEPTAVLAPAEAADLLAWTRRFADDGGSVVIIAHKLREILPIADRVTVLRRGRTVLRGEPVAAVTETSLSEAMLGTSATPAATAVARTDSAPAGAPVIVLTNVGAEDRRGVVRLRDVTLSVRSGEIVGIAAVEGAGQRELLRILAGRMSATRGTVSLPDTIGFVPEDRQRDAVVLESSLTENVALRNAGARRGLMDWSTLRAQTATLMATHDVRANGPDSALRGLSGGNQQKLVLGRELAASPAALVVENPTRGLDIRATAAIHAALRQARADGTAVVVYSADLDEVLALADRVIVVAGGVVRQTTGQRDEVGRAMLSTARS